MYAIVIYEDKNETDYLPMKWLVKKVDVADIRHLIKNKIQMQFYYPTFKNVLIISQAKQKGGTDPQTDWIIYHARILSTAENELEARQKSIDAQFLSNIDSDKGGKRKRSR
nr:uncharacterized protein LOC105849968 [Hydra vulgaris]